MNKVKSSCSENVITMSDVLNEKTAGNREQRKDQ